MKMMVDNFRCRQTIDPLVASVASVAIFVCLAVLIQIWRYKQTKHLLVGFLSHFLQWVMQSRHFLTFVRLHREKKQIGKGFPRQRSMENI